MKADGWGEGSKASYGRWIDQHPDGHHDGFYSFRDDYQKPDPYFRPGCNKCNAIKPKPSLNPTIDKLSAADNAFPVLPLKLDQFAFFPTDGELLFVGLPFVRRRYVTGTHMLP